PGSSTFHYSMGVAQIEIASELIVNPYSYRNSETYNNSTVIFNREDLRMRHPHCGGRSCRIFRRANRCPQGIAGIDG
ncbi:MAG: hypothetical protein V3W19_01070, partial [Desulfatiglandales bacterium]